MGDIFAALEEGAAPAEPHGDKSQDPLEQPASNVAGVKSTDQMAVATANRHIEPPANSGALMSSHRLFCPPQLILSGRMLDDLDEELQQVLRCTALAASAIHHLVVSDEVGVCIQISPWAEASQGYREGHQEYVPGEDFPWQRLTLQ